MNKRLWVLIAILLLVGGDALKGAAPDVQWLGVLWTKGGVSVGRAKVSSGTTVLPGDVITTSQGASAWIRFRSPASTILLADTEVALLASTETPSFQLRRGTVVVNEQAVDQVEVTVPGGFVLVKGNPQFGAECEMAALGGGAATVTVKRGLAEVHGQGEPVILHPGESSRVEAGPQGGPPVAGKINKVIPQGEILRVGQVQTLPLQLNQTIDWNDLVRTLAVGRAQIMLLDGSTLNVGARSEIKVLKHDPQAQQTEIEMTTGKVHANVQKITAPGGKFELHTKSAVIGTIDTSYVATTDDKGTRVCGVDGTTSVKSSDPNIHKEVKLHKNQCTFVLFGGAPTDPILNPALTSSLVGQTVVGGAAGGLGTGAIVAIGAGLAGGAGAAIAGVVLATGGTTSPTTP